MFIPRSMQRIQLTILPQLEGLYDCGCGDEAKVTSSTLLFLDLGDRLPDDATGSTSEDSTPHDSLTGEELMPGR
jgi:hypothetical protein